MEHKNLAAAVLERVLRDQVKARRRESLVQARSFEELLEKAIQRYLSRSVETTEVIQRLVELARELRELGKRADQLGLNREELAFYDALAENQSAKDVLGDETLSAMAHELTRLVRQNATIDWTQKRSVQAKLRQLVKRLLRRYKYPPDGAEAATETVLEQAKQLGINVTAGASDTDGDVGDWAKSEPPPAADEDVSEAPAEPLPFPIAIFDSLVRSQESGALRVDTRITGIERALAFLTACEIAWLRANNEGHLPAEALEVVRRDLGKPISMGTWLSYAIKLAKLMPKDSDDPIAQAARALVDDRNKPSRLARELETDVIPQRNVFSHGVKTSERQVMDHEGPMHAVWARLKTALAPLSSTRLISRVSVIDVEDDGAVRYKVRMLMGEPSLFPVEEVTLSGKLEERWAYLVYPDKRCLSLWPLFLVEYQQASGRHELVFARALGFTKGQKVDAMGVDSSTKAKVII